MYYKLNSEQEQEPRLNSVLQTVSKNKNRGVKQCITNCEQEQEPRLNSVLQTVSKNKNRG